MNRESREVISHFMRGFSSRRKAFWYACTLPASAGCSLCYVFPNTIWLLLLPVGLMVLLATGEMLRKIRAGRSVGKKDSCGNSRPVSCDADDQF